MSKSLVELRRDFCQKVKEFDRIQNKTRKEKREKLEELVQLEQAIKGYYNMD